MNINKIGSFGSIAATACFALLTALPAAADTISFTTTANPASVGAAGYSWTFTGATVAPPGFDPDFGKLFSGTTLSTSFGALSSVLSSGTPASSVIDIKVNPTVNSGLQASLDFKGTISSTVVSGVTEYFVNFSSTPLSSAGTGSLAGYTQIQQGGVTYAVQTVQQLNQGKITWLSGFIGGVPTAVVPEPSTFLTSGLALALAGFAMRRKLKVGS